MSIPAQPRDLTSVVVELLTDLLGGPVSVRSSVGRGFRSAWAGVVTVDSATTVFVKARTGSSVSALDHERAVLEQLPEGIGPSLYGASHSAADAVGVLALEDLSANRWPPPWDAESIARTVELLDRVGAVGPAAVAMHRLVDVASVLPNWSAVAADPAQFLATGLRSKRWLGRVLSTLLDLSFEDALDGEALVHFDVRSDNICLGPAGAVLVDWEFACLGNPRVDLLSWLPSLHAEGGPEPWVLAPEAEPGLIAFLAGYWSSQAGLAEPNGAPGLRKLQRAQASSALDWLDVRTGQSPGDLR